MSGSKSKTFPKGGIHPADQKLSAGQALVKAAVPKTAAIPVSQHIGAPSVPLVKALDKVRAGQLLAKSAGYISANTHASVSGTVKKIDMVIDTSGYARPAFIIETEGDDWEEGVDLSPDLKTDITLTPEAICARVAEAGIVGLGGAGFPSHVKLKVPEGKTAEYLIINGVECEPYLTADHRLMLEKTEELLVGVKIILQALGLRQALIGIEDNKPDAIAVLTERAQHYPGVTVHPLKVWYPQGGERQLIKALTNRELPPPPRGLPIDAGCVVFNVATVFAIYEAVQKNKPLVERVVTVTGPGVTRPGNFVARIGTSIAELVAAAGGLPGDTGKIIAGGPMMGKALASVDIPVTKGTSGVLILPNDQARRKQMINCIRCARCVMVCPLGLEPYLLMTLTDRKMYDRAEQERVANCCECACCSFVCPSNRPLLDYIKLGKTEVLGRMKARSQK